MAVFGEQPGEEGSERKRIGQYVADILKIDTIKEIFVGKKRPSRILYDWAVEEAAIEAVESTGVDHPICKAFCVGMRELSTDIDGRQLDAIAKMYAPSPTFVAPMPPYVDPPSALERLGDAAKAARGRGR